MINIYIYIKAKMHSNHSSYC